LDQFLKIEFVARQLSPGEWFASLSFLGTAYIYDFPVRWRLAPKSTLRMRS
jgi:hypothetical protein